jgi:hypothetical protein
MDWATVHTKKDYLLHWATTHTVVASTAQETIIYNLIEDMANDVNSSKSRENITKWIVGLSESTKKHGYDDDVLAIDVKPQNYTGKSLLNGSGNFTDLTWRRHEKYLRDGLVILQSGFYYGKLAYVVEFPYTAIAYHMNNRLMEVLPNGDVPKVYDRWGSFQVKHWANKATLKYKSPDITQYASGMTSPLQKQIL